LRFHLDILGIEKCFSITNLQSSASGGSLTFVYGLICSTLFAIIH